MPQSAGRLFVLRLSANHHFQFSVSSVLHMLMHPKAFRSLICPFGFEIPAGCDGNIQIPTASAPVKWNINTSVSGVMHRGI